MNLDGKIALVTGARGGIGRAICARFEQEGALVFAADIDPRGSLGQEGGAGDFLRLDVTSEDAVETAFASIGARHERLDVLVNAAGIEIEKTIEETSLEEWNRLFAINVTGMFLVCKHALPLLRVGGRREAGASVVNLGSYDGFLADPKLAAYCASKGAVHALTRAMACDHGPENIRVNAICPGYIETPMLDSFFTTAGAGGNMESLRQAIRAVHPLGRHGKPQDVAGLACWLASDEARYASGQLWVLDGGLSAQIQQMKP